MVERDSKTISNVLTNYVRLWKEDKSNPLLSFLDISPYHLSRLERGIFGGENVRGMKFQYCFDKDGFEKASEISPEEWDSSLFSIYGFLLNEEWNSVLYESSKDLCDSFLSELYSLSPEHPYLWPAMFDREGKVLCFDEALLMELTETTNEDLLMVEERGIDTASTLAWGYANTLEQRVIELREQQRLISLLKNERPSKDLKSNF